MGSYSRMYKFAATPVLFGCICRLSAILADQLLIPFYITHCRMFVHCRHIGSLSVTDHPILHIVTDCVFDSCFILLFHQSLLLHFMCACKILSLVVFEWQYYAFKIQGLCIGEIILALLFVSQ